MKYIFRFAPVTYEDCGVLGGRISNSPGGRILIPKNKKPQEMMRKLMNAMRLKSQAHGFRYPFDRFAIFFINIDGSISTLYTPDDAEDGMYGYFNDIDSIYGEGLLSIGHLIQEGSIQIYDIYQQVKEDIYEIISYKTPKDKEKYGHAYDVFRCLDMQGLCKAKIIESNDSFHNYVKYDLGEDFYVECYDNSFLEMKEYWIGREYMHKKFVIGHIEEEYGLSVDQLIHKDIVIDLFVAEKMCELTDKHEYLYLDNERNLKMMVLRMDGDEDLGIWDD